MLRDIARGEDAQIAAIVQIIASVQPDILLLTDFDYDLGGVTLDAFAQSLADAGLALPHAFALRPNAGMATGLDMDGDGRTGAPRDAQGYGRFAGNGGLAILSRWPIRIDDVQDFSGLLWRDLPGAVLPMQGDQPFPSAAAQAVQRLSSTAHWSVPIVAPGGDVVLLAWSATPPVFDGPEDMNGLRGRDELLLWRHHIEGNLGAAPAGHFVLLGNANLDPFDGDGRRDSIAQMLRHPALIDPQPVSAGGAAADDPGHSGPPARDTADWPDNAPGNLRVSYVLPSVDWTIVDTGVFWPAPDTPGADLLGTDGQLAGAHRLVWVELSR
ncbi:MAG: endonuclease/exonuclease/phosphatase family protein [Rhodobacteraceae bacterium]|nr:endonuclease/exonuclease/phosphatase family protein [Paracoccaceae bacterium]